MSSSKFRGHNLYREKTYNIEGILRTEKLLATFRHSDKMRQRRRQQEQGPMGEMGHRDAHKCHKAMRMEELLANAVRIRIG